MRKLCCICLGIWLCGLLAGSVRAETYQLADGSSYTGEVVSFNESGMIIRQTDDKYSDRISWTKLSQESLKKLVENPKIQPFVEPFIEVSLEGKPKKTEVEIRAPERLKRPEARSLLGALFSSSVGLFVLLLVYVANLYAAYEISICRGRPAKLVCGVSALLPVVGPIVFLFIPAPADRSAGAEEEEAPQPDPAVPVPAASSMVSSPAATRPFMPPSPAAGGVPRPAFTVAGSAAGQGGPKPAPAGDAGSTSAIPQKQVFQRGAFTFNRRFFETKFAGFLTVVRRDADKDMVMVVKSARGNYVGQRITKLTAGEFHLQVQKGDASEEVMIPFTEIKEITLQHKDA